MKNLIPTDDELIREIKSGSQAAMEVLVKRHYNTILSYCTRHTGNYQVGCDLTQDVFIKMMESLSRYKSYGIFINWLMTIAVNRCKNYFASSYVKYNSKSLHYDTYEQESKCNVSNLVEKQMQMSEIREHLLTIPELQREAIILRYYHDKSTLEIAEITGVSNSTVKYRLKKGIEVLKNLYEGESNEKQSKI